MVISYFNLTKNLLIDFQQMTFYQIQLLVTLNTNLVKQNSACLGTTRDPLVCVCCTKMQDKLVVC